MVGAPYVLCVFVVGVILMGVGTFVTSHAYEDDPKDPVLIVVGPTLLGLGGKHGGLSVSGYISTFI